MSQAENIVHIILGNAKWRHDKDNNDDKYGDFSAFGRLFGSLKS